MSEQIREQVSAFLDGELPSSETELLLKRLTRDSELRESFGRYALIGESVRGMSRAPVSPGFAGRVNCAIDGEPVAASAPPPPAQSPRWWRPIAGAAAAAGVAAVAVVALQQRAVTPGSHGLPVAAQNITAQNITAPNVAVQIAAQNAAAPGAQAGHPKEAIAYTVPAASTDAPAVLPAARLTNYIFAHSRYSSVLGKSNVLSGLLADADEPGPDNVRSVNGAAVNDATLHQPLPQDPRVAP